MDEVFVKRMGGAHPSPQNLHALEGWVFALKPLPPSRATDDPKAMRGQELFNSREVGCAACHAGAKLTNNLSYDVGTGADVPLQVPSLIGVGSRTPLIHTGCAKTLYDRFDPSCGGGDAHGHTSQLSEADIDALVAYMQSL
jgi:mono/diheme cytochrome c family protein